MELTTNNYQKILSEIKQYIQNTKIEMYWNIGKILAENSVDTATMELLANDLMIDFSYLYKMQNFYKAYPKELPRTDLNWSQYLVLSEIKDTEFRNILEQKAVEQDLTVKEIQNEIKKAKEILRDPSTSLGSAQNDDAEVATYCNASLQKPTKLTPNRGVLYHYKIADGKLFSDSKICLDLGFGIFKNMNTTPRPEEHRVIPQEVNLNLEENQIVKINKIDDEYFIEKSGIVARKIHTYKGYLTRIVDGDTIRVIIDFGFEVFREEILRLKDVYAEEMKTEKGKEQKKILEKILKNVEFVILRTYKTDMYGRYVCDIFYDKNEKDEQKVADEGIFLNQELVNKYTI